MITKAVRSLFDYLAVVLVIQSAIVSGQQPTLVTQTGHTGEVISVAVNAGGTLLATGGDDATIKVWHTASRRIVRVLRGHTSQVMSLAFHPKRPILASAGAMDPTIKLWNLEESGTPLEFKGPPVTYGTLAFSPDGSWLIHGGPFGVAAWEVATGRRKQIDTRRVETLALSLDGSILATGNAEGTITIWRGSKRRILETLAAVPQTINRSDTHGGVFGLAISPNNLWLATAGATIDVWDLTTAAHLKTLGRRAVGVQRPVAFSPDGTILAAADSAQATELPESNTGGSFGGIENAALSIWRPGTWKQTRTLVGHTAAIHAITFNSDGKSISLVSAGRDGTVRFWDPAKQTEIRNPTLNVTAITSVVFTPDDKRLVMSSGRNVVVWDLGSGAPQLELIGHESAVTSVAVSPKGNVIASGSEDKTVRLWDAFTGKLLKKFDKLAIDVRCVVFSPEGEMLAVGGEDQGDGTAAHESGGVIILQQLANGFERQVIKAHVGTVTSLAFSPDGRTLASGSYLVTKSGKIPADESTLSFWDVVSGREVQKPIGRQTVGTKAIAYSSVGILAVGRAAVDPNNPAKLFLAGGDTVISEIDVRTGRTESTQVIKQEHGEDSGQDLRLWSASGKPLHTAPYSGIVTALSFLPGGQTLATGGADNSIRLWDVESGGIIKTLFGHSGIVSALTVSRNGQLMASGAQDGTIVVWTLSNNEQLARLVYLDENNWIVVLPDGHFDTNSLEEITSVQWVFPDDPFRPLPPEIFMRQYYEPRLLSRALNPNNRFDPLPPLAALNRVQPEVEIGAVLPAPNARNLVNVKVKVLDAKGQQTRDGRQVILHSGAYDLRLFRDGQVVKYRPGEVKLNQGGRATIDFNVRLPRRTGQEEVEFSAYAFNSNRVKSNTAKRIYKLPKAFSPRKGRAYVIAVGVNAYEDAGWDLNFAASDARVTQQAVVQRLSATQTYSEVIPIALISDYEKGANGRRTTERSATARNFFAVLDLLAGRHVEPRILRDLPGANRIEKAEPEDFILISFSSHGYTDKQGKFYLVPFDTGHEIKFSPDGREIAAESLSRFISSDELSELMRDIDAGELVMIVDTCHSAAAVDAEGFKPGPMGSRGMGQLAYDKGMRILAASQADDVALEVSKLRQGLLTYALIREGLERAGADKDGDGQITLDEWLAYGTERVPLLYDDVKAGRVSELKKKDLHITAVLSGASVTKSAFQQPQLFDFKRKRRHLLLASTNARVST